MDKPKKETMDVMMHMQRNAWRERQPIQTRHEYETTPMYDTSAIYDNPGPYMTVRGMFRYTGVDVIA